MKPSKALTFCMLAFSYLMPSFSESAEDDRECFTSRAGIRHKEPNGIGYNQGYSTLEVFGAPRYLSNANILPFIDARLHLFNDGDPAVNAGVGARYLGRKYVWGINSYYDYRKTSHWHYNQYSLGLEMLGKRFDIRLNGYLPLGSKESKYYDRKFSHFEDHYAIISRKREFAMKGGNAEFGYHIKDLKKISVYGALGPYYFTNHGKNAIGGEGRINVTVLNHIKLELSGSYDQVFKWIGQGEAGLYISFGPKVKVKKKTNASSYTCDILAQRLTQPVDRQEIVVLDKYKKRTKAIDPSTNSPYYFVFVDNQSHSLGTYESPYTTIADAENASSPGDILYVFPGDGTAYDMGTSGLQLQDNQKLFGSGTNQSIVTTVGNILIPNQTNTMPTISESSTSGIIHLADNNEISGIYIATNSDGSNAIYGENINNTFIHDNIITSTNNNGMIVLNDGQGNIFINNNTMIGSIELNAENDAVIAYELRSGSSNVQIINNSISTESGGNGLFQAIFLGSNGSSTCVAQIIGNNIIFNETSQFAEGIQVHSYDGSTFIFSIEKNQVYINGIPDGSQTFPQAIYATSEDSSHMTGQIQFNNVTALNTTTNDNSSPVKGIAFVNYSSIPPLISINNNLVNVYSDNVGDTLLDSIAGIRVKNLQGSMNCDIFSNSITVSGKQDTDSSNPPRGIFCVNAEDGESITGSIFLNTGSVFGPNATDINCPETMVNVNNNINEYTN